MTDIEQQKIAEACSILFGSSFTFKIESLGYLQESGVKKAFRTRAKTCHPDLASTPGYTEPAEGDFFEIKEAYDFLLRVVQNRSSLTLPRNGNFETFHDKAGSSSQPRGEEPGFPFTYYSGPVPRRELKLGEFLYYRGLITWADLIEAIVWQRRYRPKLGTLSVKKELLTPEERDWILGICRDDGKTPFGTAAVREGLLDHSELKRLLILQKSLFPFGRFFLDKGLILPEVLAAEAAEKSIHNRLILAGKEKRTASPR